MNYAKDFSTKKMMQDIEEKIQSYLSEEDKPVEPKGMLERKNSTNEIDGDSVVADSLADLITKASDNKAKRYRGMNFRAERPRSSPEEINEFLANMKEVNRIAPGFYYDKDDRNNPMDFSGSIVKEDRQTDALIDIAETALEQPVEIPTLDIAEAIEQDQVEQQDTSTLKGSQTGLMTKPVSVAKDPTQQLLDRIALGEGADPMKLRRQAKHGIGTTEYDMVYNYGDTLKPNKPITEMKLSELADYQRKLINATKGTLPGTKNGTSAVGKYQVVYTSLFGKNGTPQAPGKNSWADKLNLKADTIYSPSVQESIGRLALKETGYDNWMAGKKSEKAMLQRIADIWASVEGSTAKQGTHTSLKDLEPFLLQVRP